MCINNKYFYYIQKRKMSVNNYEKIDWRRCSRELALIQNDIVKAYRAENFTLVQQLQHKLVRSFAARALAVRRVSSTKGKNTPGIDKTIWTSNEQKCVAIIALSDLSSYECKPVRRVYIPKPDGSMRPLGIPNMFDRAVQTLFAFALDPIAEETACTRSYGYRPFRGAHDCATYLKLVLGNVTNTRRFVLEADIKGFFPSVCHDWLLENIPMNKDILRKTLQAGYLEDNDIHESPEGFPPGSPISSVLANLTLNGLGDLLLKEKFLYTRYADDFVVLGKSKENLENVARPIIDEFLAQRGLILSPDKTGIVTMRQGFDFLGFRFREYQDSNRVKGTKQGIWLVTPSPRKLNAFRRELNTLIKKHNDKSFFNLVLQLNSKLRGWAGYYRKVTSKVAFSKINYTLFNALWRKLKRKHRRLGKRALVDKYFTTVKGNRWVFVADKGGEKQLLLFQIANVSISYHIIRPNFNSYDLQSGAIVEKLIEKHSKTVFLRSSKEEYLARKQKGICPVCSQSLLNGEKLQLVLTEPPKGRGRKPLVSGFLTHIDCAKQIN
jgi:RNA-directed DNA polymerase